MSTNTKETALISSHNIFIDIEGFEERGTGNLFSINQFITHCLSTFVDLNHENLTGFSDDNLADTLSDYALEYTKEVKPTFFTTPQDEENIFLKIFNFITVNIKVISDTILLIDNVIENLCSKFEQSVTIRSVSIEETDYEFYLHVKVVE